MSDSEKITLNVADCRMLMHIALADEEGMHLSLKSIAELISSSQQTAMRTCRKLRRNGMIDVETCKATNGGQTANTYRLTETGKQAFRSAVVWLANSDVIGMMKITIDPDSTEGTAKLIAVEDRNLTSPRKDYLSASLTKSDMRFLDFVRLGVDGVDSTSKGMADILGVCPRTVTRSKRKLEAQGLVKSTARFKEDGAQLSNLYQITEEGLRTLEKAKAKEREKAKAESQPKRPHRLPVRCIDTGKVYESARAAGKALSQKYNTGADHNGRQIVRCCRHERLSWHGTTWEFVFDGEEGEEGSGAAATETP